MSELEDAKRVKELIQKAMDNWPDVGELNPAFNQLASTYSLVSTWVKQHEDNG